MSNGSDDNELQWAACLYIRSNKYGKIRKVEFLEGASLEEVIRSS